MNRTIEYAPTALAIDGVDLKAPAGTRYVSPFLDLSSYANFLVSFVIRSTGTGPAGDCTLAIQLYNTAENNLFADVEILKRASTAGNKSEMAVFGANFKAGRLGAATLGADIEALKMFTKVRLYVLVDSPSSVATCLGYLYLLAKN